MGNMSEPSSLRYSVALFLLVLYIVVISFANNGFREIITKFRFKEGKQRRKLTDAGNNISRKGIKSMANHDDIEGVSIVRPLKGVDPEMSSCLESSFLQDYPYDKFEILFCVDDPEDPCIPIVEDLIKKHPYVNARILLSTNYDKETKISDDHYGPNPKVNNLAKGFVAAKYDIIWAIDSNVWAPSRVLRRSVKGLQQSIDNGRVVNGKRKVKLIHHTPLAVSFEKKETTLQVDIGSESESESESSKCTHISKLNCNNKEYGSKLDEMFLFTSHSKFYTTFNNIAIAPCVNGKSNIYRKSDLDFAVSQIPKVSKKSEFFNSPVVLKDAAYYSSLGPGHSIKFFSRYIGEDNMIGICLWENALGRTGMTGDVVVQPLDGINNGINDYMLRRIRWLRVRKYMVLMATLLEPATESILCTIYGNFAIMTIFFGRSWSWWFFWIHMSIWVVTDYIQYYVLLNNAIHSDTILPTWLQENNLRAINRSILDWFVIWLGRELLALPIWIRAIVGHSIDWRGKPFKIKKDLTAEEL